jgi:serralysin
MQESQETLTLMLSGYEISESSGVGAAVLKINIVDQNGSRQDASGSFYIDRYTIEIADDRFSYEFDAAQGGLMILKSTISYEALSDKFIKIRVLAKTGTAGNMQTLIGNFDVEIRNSEEAPKDLTMSGGAVGEDAAAGTVVATLNAIDEDAGDQARLSYAFVTDAGGKTVTTDPLFEIVGNTIRLKSQPGNAKAGTYTLWVRALDQNTAHTETEPDMWTAKQITLTITDTIKNSVEPVNTVEGGAANDRLAGTAGADNLIGGAGNDTFYGYSGNDTLLGGAGKDSLYAGDGDDVLIGGLSKDKLYGGSGQDTFVFDTAVRKGQFDQIYDFKPSDDTIQISLAALKAFKVKGPKTSDVHSKKSSDDKGKPDDKGGSKTSVGFDKIFLKDQKLQKKFFNVGTKLKDTPDGSNDYIFYNKKNGIVYLDIDGSGKGKGIEIFKVKPGIKLTADDFLFI